MFSDRQKKASTYNGLLLSKRTSSVCPTSLHIKEFFCQTASATSFILYPRVLFFFFFFRLHVDRQKKASTYEGILLSKRTSSVEQDFFCQKGLLVPKRTSSVCPTSFILPSRFFFLFLFFFCMLTDRRRQEHKKKFKEKRIPRVE